MRLERAVRSAITAGASSTAYMGTVTAIDAVGFALSVDIGTGTDLTGVRWIGSYTPAVDDFVVVLRVGHGWWVLGKNSKDLKAPPPAPPPTVYTEVLTPTVLWDGSRDVSGSSWSWAARSLGETWPAMQGRSDQRSASGTLIGSYVHAGLVRYAGTSLAAMLPAGATIQTAKIQLARVQSYYHDGTNGTPVLYGHAYTSTPPGTPAFVSGVGPWRPGHIQVGKTLRWDLPSSWVTAWLAGTVRGFGIYSTAYADHMALTAPSSFQVIVTYI